MVCWFGQFQSIRGASSRIVLSTKEKNSFPMLNFTCGKSLFFTSYVEMGFIEDACLKMRSVVSYTIAMLQPTVSTLNQIKRLWKYSKQATSNSHSSRMQGNLSWLMADVKEQGTLPRGMRCLKVAYLRWNCLMYGGLTSYVSFLLPITTFTSLWWWLTMFLSGWKPLPP